MYDNFYIYDEVEVYVYECEICKSAVKSRKILECVTCKKRLCGNKGCNAGGMCFNHYEMLTPEDKEVFKLIKLEEDGPQLINCAMGCITAINLIIGFLLMMSFISDKSNYEYTITLMIIFFILFMIALIILLFYESYAKQRDELYAEKKLKIFSKYRQ